MQCLMACGVVPLRQQHDQIWVEALILESVDALDDLLLLEVNDRDRAVAHARQAEEIVLHEGVSPVLGERHVVGARRRRDRLQELGLFGVLQSVCWFANPARV